MVTSLWVCPVSDLKRVTGELDGFDLLTLLSPDHADEDHRGLACDRHLELRFNDIVEPQAGLVSPDRELLANIIAFGRQAQNPVVIHCWAGISRSSAAAYVLACDRSAGHESDIADELRRRAPFATPNRLMVALADHLLGRQGKMVAAIDRIGRGAEAAQGTPYQLPLRWPIR